MQNVTHFNNEQRLFAVGDDWQSIYRFTGSELSNITAFEKYFGYTKQTFLDCTFRFNDKIALFTSKFIQKNPKQLKKSLKTLTITNDSPYIIFYKDFQPPDQPQNRKIISCLHKIKEKENNNQASVFILWEI